MKKHGIYELPDTTLADTFLEGEGISEYVKDMNDRLQNGETVEGVSFYSIGVDNFIKLYNRIENKIAKLECDKDQKCQLMQEIRLLLGLKNKDTKMLNNIDINLNNDYYHKSDYLKTLLSETLVELVDEGVFNDAQMQVVENQIALLLKSNEDYRPVAELEK